MKNNGPPSEEDVEEALEEVERVMGLTEEEPAFSIECPGCDATVDVWDRDALPMDYECYTCAANFEVRGPEEVVRVEGW